MGDVAYSRNPMEGDGMKTRLLVVNLVLFSLTVAWFYPFFCIVKDGGHYVAEWILWFALIVILLIAGFSVVNVGMIIKRWILAGRKGKGSA